MRLWFRLSDSPTVAELVLDLLLELGGDETTEAEVRSILDLNRASSARVLASLRTHDIVKTRRVGRTILYSVDPTDPLVKQLKTAKAVYAAQLALAPVADGVDLAVLFGSEARGESTVDSDLDLFVVTAHVEEVREALAGNARLQPVVVSPSEYVSMLAQQTAFAAQVARGVTIIGG